MLSLRSRHQESMASRVQRAGLLLETPGAVQNHVSVIQIHVCWSAHAEAAKLIGSFLETCCTLSAWPICVVVLTERVLLCCPKGCVNICNSILDMSALKFRPVSAIDSRPGA